MQTVQRAQPDLSDRKDRRAHKVLRVRPVRSDLQDRKDRRGLIAYGGLYGTTTDAVALTTTPVALPLGTQMPSSNLTYGTNSVTVTDAGTYELAYGVRGSMSDGSSLTVSVGQNGTAIAATTITDALTSGTPSSVHGQTIVTLSAGDVLTLLASDSGSATWTPGSGANTYLTVKKLD